MWFFILLGVFFRLAIANKITIEPGKTFTFTTKGYPNINYEAGEENYDFDSKPGSQIIAICTDFRVIEKPNPCDSFSMSFKDGEKVKTFCTNGNNVEFLSASSWLKVNIKYQTGGLVSCTLRSTADPPVEEIIINPEDNHVLDFPNERVPLLDKAWIFKHPEGKNFKLECSATLSGVSNNCNQDSVIYGVGSNRKHLCKSDTFLVKGKEIFLRALLGSSAQGFVRCYAEVHSSDIQEPPTNNKNSFQINEGEIHDFELGKPHQEIDFSTTNGNNLHLFCGYMYVHDKQNPCDEVLIKISEETKYCGETDKDRFNYFSKGSSLKLISTFKYERKVLCKAVANPKTVEFISLDVSDGVYHFRHEGEHVNNYNKGWNFKTRPGTKLSIQCDISFTSYNNQQICTEAVLRVNDGGGKEQNFCGAKKIVLISKQTDLNVIIQVMTGSSGNFFCDVQAITGPDPNQINNLKIEDSHENAGNGKGRLSTTCACGRRNKKKFNGRIINGNSTNEGEYTWIASIRYGKNSQRCGGSIITPYHVLTAAHCMTDSKVRKKYEIWYTEVYVGAYKLHEDASHKMTKGYGVQRTLIPEEYWDFKKHYDIAVLYLEEKIAFNEYVGPVCLSPSPPQLLHKALNSIGWGKTENNGPAPELLQTKLFVREKSNCGNVDYIICTYNKDTSTCYGDSGGPLSYLDEDTNLYTQVGVVSYGTAVDCRSSSGFSNITYHWKYIMDAIKETNPSANICQKLQ